jgi:integrase
VLHTTPGVARRRFHDLRHTFASRLAAIGVQPHAIRALLGHAPFNTTDEYLHASDTELHAAIADLEKFNSEMLKQAAGKDTEKTEQEITKELS